jgi:hypothetical protein
MSAEQALRPMALCELCYLDDHILWEPESMNEDGQILMKLISVDVPEKVNTESVETCCMCGSITVAGIFEMMNPKEVYFLEDDELESNFVMSLGDDDEAFDEGL